MSCLQRYAVVVGKSAVSERQRILLCDVSQMVGKVGEGNVDTRLKKQSAISVQW